MPGQDKDKEKKSKKDKPKDDKPQPPPQPKPKPKPQVRGPALIDSICCTRNTHICIHIHRPQARIVKKKEEDFYAGMDLPSSESSGDEREQVQRQDKEIVIHTFTSAKEQRKRDKKDKEAQEAQERLKQMALREDDETAISVVLSSGSSRAVDPNSRDVKVKSPLEQRSGCRRRSLREIPFSGDDETRAPSSEKRRAVRSCVCQ